MRTADFDYALPAELIAQRPARPRDSSRLMVVDRRHGTLSHHHFRDLPGLLHPGDTLVLNQTRVIPARLHAHKIPTGGRVELLLLRRLAPQTWEALVGGKGLKPGKRLAVDGGPEAEILEDRGGGRRVLRFSDPIRSALERIGEMPLPPYIKTPLHHSEEYQTVFAAIPGSAAAPTAGLHFTPKLLKRLHAKGVTVAKITLHVGLDTFAPVREAAPEDHPIHSEWFQVPAEAAETINATRAADGRIIAVGTTTARALETAARAAPSEGVIAPIEGSTDLYILPGFEFRAVDALVTNFHLPRSTLLMMVCAFAGKDTILEAYEVAKAAGYRFYSFGDAMLIL